MTNEEGRHSFGMAPLKVEGGWILILHPHLQDFINRDLDGVVQKEMRDLITRTNADKNYYRNSKWVRILIYFNILEDR